MAMLEVDHLQKIYTTRFGASQVQALTDVTFSVEKGEYVAIMGESGSGKTTLLNILAALDKPTRGEVRLNGKLLSSISEKALSAFRRDNLGFVFQDFNLLDTFSIRDNIFLPLVLAGCPYREMENTSAPSPRSWASAASSPNSPTKSAAARNSAPPSPAPSSPGPSSFWRTSPPVRWTAVPQTAFCACLAKSTRTARPSSWLHTRSRRPAMRDV